MSGMALVSYSVASEAVSMVQAHVIDCLTETPLTGTDSVNIHTTKVDVMRRVSKQDRQQ